MRKGDIILIAVLLAAVTVCFAFPSGATRATVYYKGKEYKTVSLNENVTVEVGGTVIKTENGEVFFESSDCPEQVCVRSGRLHLAGQTASCVPNGVVIVLSGKNSPDGVTG